MKVELAIISIIAVVGAVLFLPQTISLFPNTPQIFNGISDDVSNFQTDTKEKIGQTIEKPVEKLNSGIQDLKANSIDLINPQNIEAPIVTASQEISKPIQEAIFYGKIKDDSVTSNPQELTPEPKTATTEEQPVVIHSAGTSSKTSASSSASTSSSTTSEPSQSPSVPFFQTLSLTTKKQADNNVLLSYVDTTGKTKSVKVTLRNSEKTLFEGTFFASKFEAYVFDASDTPHFIDMVVDNEEYGTITSSVFNPAGNTDTTINGVFTKP